MPAPSLIWQNLPDTTVLLGILPILVSLAGALVTLRVRQRQNITWFHKYYEQPARQSINKKEAVQAFYGFVANEQLTPLEYAAARIPASRAVLPRLLELINGREPFLLIHIEGGRNEGKTTLLAQAAFSIGADNRTFIAYHRHSEFASEGFDAERLLTHWRRGSAFWGSYRRRHLLVLLDEFVSVTGDGRPIDRSQFVQRLQKASGRFHRIRIVSASNLGLQLSATRLALRFEEGEEESFLKQLMADGIVDSSLSFSEILLRTGGRRIYKDSLRAFLASVLLVAKAPSTRLLRLDDLAIAARDRTKRIVEITAACQVLDLEVPDSLIPRFTATPAEHLMSETSGWIRRRPLSFVQAPQMGAALTAPHLAELILRGQSITGARLKGLYETIFGEILQRASNEYVHREFLRHILYRLARERGIRVEGGRTRYIAKGIYTSFDRTLEKWFSGVTALGELASWFATLVRLESPRAPAAGARAFDLLRSGQTATFAVIAQLAHGCHQLRLGLTSEELALISPLAVLDPVSPRHEKDRRRQNEVVTTYSSLLLRHGRPNEALDLFEQVEEWVELDARSLLAKAKLQARLAPEHAVGLFERAIELAQDELLWAPEAIVDAHIAFGDFAKRNPSIAGVRKPQTYYEQAEYYISNAPSRVEALEERLGRRCRSDKVEDVV